MDLRVAFWNVCNLFPAGLVDRGPKTRQELNARLDNIAGCINGFFGGDGPDVLGIAEVAEETLLRALLRRLNGRFQYIWEPPRKAMATGIAFAHRQRRLSNVKVRGVSAGAKRPWVLLVDAELPMSTNADRTAVFAVVHLKSDYQESAVSVPAWKERCNAAAWLASEVDACGHGRSIVVMGDFNAEPFEPPFQAPHLGSTRLFSTALRGTRLYNTAWKLFPEPDAIDDYRQKTFALSRPVTSFGHEKDGKRRILDHLLVGGGALRGGPLLLRERSVCYHWVAGVNATRTKKVIKPLRFHYDPSTGTAAGASDHFPLLAEFAVV